MASPNITPRHAAIRAYYDERQQLMAQGVTHELAIREAFKSLLSRVVGLKKWTLVVEQKVEGLSRVVRPDGTVRDAHTLPRGYWEAKDTMMTWILKSQRNLPEVIREPISFLRTRDKRFCTSRVSELAYTT